MQTGFSPPSRSTVTTRGSCRPPVTCSTSLSVTDARTGFTGRVLASTDGWTTCALGHRHWGRAGAAGLLLHRDGEDGPEVLLQHRAWWSHHGGTWGTPGGALHIGESP